MTNSQRAWELAMVLVASGKIPFDPANISGSIKILERHLEALEEALQSEPNLSEQAQRISSLQRPAESPEVALT